jgi:dihydrodipicolinate synthase/N-acetylneuraminate lyase
MEATETIPPEVRAGVEANALFDAVRRGDYAAAAKAQERLKELGWTVTRDGQPKRIKKGVSPCQ